MSTCAYRRRPYPPPCYEDTFSAARDRSTPTADIYTLDSTALSTATPCASGLDTAATRTDGTTDNCTSTFDATIAPAPFAIAFATTPFSVTAVATRPTTDFVAIGTAIDAPPAAPASNVEFTAIVASATHTRAPTADTALYCTASVVARNVAAIDLATAAGEGTRADVDVRRPAFAATIAATAANLVTAADAAAVFTGTAATTTTANVTADPCSTTRCSARRSSPIAAATTAAAATAAAVNATDADVSPPTARAAEVAAQPRRAP